MPDVLLIAGSPSYPSRSAAALQWIGATLEGKGFSADQLVVSGGSRLIEASALMKKERNDA